MTLTPFKRNIVLKKKCYPPDLFILLLEYDLIHLFLLQNN